jgi:hypothetical protein
MAVTLLVEMVDIVAVVQVAVEWEVELEVVDIVLLVLLLEEH